VTGGESAGWSFRHPVNKSEEKMAMSDIRQVLVHCTRGGKLLASIPLGIPRTLDDSKVTQASRQKLIEDAKAGLSSLGLAGPRFEGIEFDIEYK
jgi:hypothetical protein